MSNTAQSLGEDEFRQLAARNNEFHAPIFDGVVDDAKFYLAEVKILWVLKEPWEKLEPGVKGGDWSVTRDLLLNGELENNKGTYPPMAYVSYAVENGYLDYESIPMMTHDATVRESLRSLAYINIKKFPGSTSSTYAEIQFFFDRYKEFLLAQIQAIPAEVIIFGSTFCHFRPHLDLGEFEQSDGRARYATSNGRLYIDTYHPSQRTIGKGAYVENIVSIIRSHKKSKPVD
jgi:hypothetical protein